MEKGFSFLSSGVFAGWVRLYWLGLLLLRARAPQRCELHFTGPPIWSIQIYKSNRRGTNPYIYENQNVVETDTGVNKPSLTTQPI